MTPSTTAGSNTVVALTTKASARAPDVFFSSTVASYGEPSGRIYARAVARTIEETRLRVHTWDQTIRDDSAMYSTLARHVAQDTYLLDLIRSVPKGQIEMNMLLAAVQYLLLEDPSQELAAWYPSLGGTADRPGLESAFTGFVSTHRDAIHELITSRRVQTNEVARCVFLLPAYNVIQEMAGRPLALAEIGTSAGLNQNVDRYGYTYGSSAGTVTLASKAAVQLSTQCGADVPLHARKLPEIGWRIGVDLHPIDVADDDQARWLRALVWPDQAVRHTRLAAAIDVARAHPPRLVEADALAAVPAIVDQAPIDCALVFQHSFVLNQLSSADRERFYDLLDELAAQRSIYRVGAEWLTRIRQTVLTVTEHGRNRRMIELGNVHHHGGWIRLNDPA